MDDTSTTSGKVEPQKVLNVFLHNQGCSRMDIALLDFIFGKLPKLRIIGKLIDFSRSELRPITVSQPRLTGGSSHYAYFICNLKYDKEPFEVDIIVRVHVVQELRKSMVAYVDGYTVTGLPRYELPYLNLSLLEFTPVEPS